MWKKIKRTAISCVFAIILECLICFVYSHFLVLAENGPLQFSVSRVVAILVVYWGVYALGLFQKNPDYGILVIEGEKK